MKKAEKTSKTTSLTGGLLMPKYTASRHVNGYRFTIAILRHIPVKQVACYIIEPC